MSHGTGSAFLQRQTGLHIKTSVVNGIPNRTEARFTIVPTGSGSFTVQRSRDHTYAAGLSPIGLKLNFRRSQTLQPFASGSGGFLYFSKDVPLAGTARFNFTFDFGGGVQIVKNTGRAITIGYKYQHISNGDRSPINPGADVQVLYAGFSIFK